MTDPTVHARVGFFTDTTVCIGCKACEVACKEWNGLPSLARELTGNSYDNTGALDEHHWRHVAFVEQPVAATSTLPASMVWLMSSDVCKHCTEAACLDVCPTGSLVRTEFATVVVQPDICNGCGYCVPACPYGVIGRDETQGSAAKCTLCYDRLKGGQQPACAQACPTDSIQFGPLVELRERAAERLAFLQDSGDDRARLYGHDPDDGVGGAGAMFLLRDRPECYGLPPAPRATTRDLGSMWRTAATAAATMIVGLTVVIVGRRP